MDPMEILFVLLIGAASLRDGDLILHHPVYPEAWQLRNATRQSFVYVCSVDLGL